MLSFLALLCMIPATTLAAALAPRNSTACNNSPDLCARSYSNITYLGAHDSPFLRDSSTDNSDSGNQYFNSTIQLDAGVRLLTAQVFNNNGSLDLCHTSCTLLNAGSLSGWLAGIKKWMDGNPNDVVTIILVDSDSIPASDLSTAFESSNITSYTYAPPLTTNAALPTTWPDLNTLIAANTRLLTFVASLIDHNPTAPYLLDEFAFIWENPYEVTSLTNFSCLPSRPAILAGDTSAAISSGRMALMNHFLDEQEILNIEIPDVGNITTTNAPSSSIVGALGSAAANCTALYSKAPNFVLVDFFDQGPAIATVDKLNGITPVGRRMPPGKGAEGASAATSSASRTLSGASGTATSTSRVLSSARSMVLGSPASAWLVGAVAVLWLNF